ncbi:MAG: hypothetical protein AB8U31_02355 [Anaplasma ovis]
MPTVEPDANSVEFWCEDIAELGRAADPHMARATVTQHANLRALSGEEFCGCIHRGLLTTVDGGKVPKISVEDLDRIRHKVGDGALVLQPDFMRAPARWCNRHLPGLAVGVHVMHHLLLNRQYSVMGPEETISRIRGNVYALSASHVHQALIFEIVKAFNSECISGNCGTAVFHFISKHEMTAGGVEESRHIHRVSDNKVLLEHNLSVKIIPQSLLQEHTAPTESESTGTFYTFMETEASVVEGAVRYETTIRFKIAKEILNHIAEKRSAGGNYQPRDSDLVVLMRYPHFEVPFDQMHEEVSLVVKLDEAKARGNKHGIEEGTQQHAKKGVQAPDYASQTLFASAMARMGNLLGRNTPKPEQQQNLKSKRIVCKAAILDQSDSTTNFRIMDIKGEVDSALIQENGNYALHGIVSHTFPHAVDWRHEEAFITNWFRKQPTETGTHEQPVREGEAVAAQEEGGQHENMTTNEGADPGLTATVPAENAEEDLITHASITNIGNPVLSRSSSTDDGALLSDTQNSSGHDSIQASGDLSDPGSSSGFLSADSGEEATLTPEEEEPKQFVEAGTQHTPSMQHATASDSADPRPHEGTLSAQAGVSLESIGAVGGAAEDAESSPADVYSLHKVCEHNYVNLSSEEVERIIDQWTAEWGAMSSFARQPKPSEHQLSIARQVAAEILLYTLHRLSVSNTIRAGLEAYGPSEVGRSSAVDFPREDLRVNDVYAHTEDVATELASTLRADHSDTADAEQLAALHGMEYRGEYAHRFDPGGERLKAFAALKYMFVQSVHNSAESGYAVPHPALIEEMVNSLNQAGAVASPKASMLAIITRWGLQDFGVLVREEGHINRASSADNQAPVHSTSINCTDSNKVSILIMHSTIPWVSGLARASMSYDLHFSPEDNSISYKNVYIRVALPGSKAKLPPLEMLTGTYAQPETTSIPDTIPEEGIVIVHKMEDMKISVREMLKQDRKEEVVSFLKHEATPALTADTAGHHAEGATTVEETWRGRLRECGATLMEENRPLPRTTHQGADEEGQNTGRTPWYMAPWNLLCGVFRAIGSFIARLARTIVNICRCGHNPNYDTLIDESEEIAVTDTHNTTESVQEGRERQHHTSHQPAQQGVSAVDPGTATPTLLRSDERGSTHPQGEGREQEAGTPTVTPPSTKLDSPHKLGEGATTRRSSFAELHERLRRQYDVQQQARR